MGPQTPFSKKKRALINTLLAASPRKVAITHASIVQTRLQKIRDGPCHDKGVGLGCLNFTATVVISGPVELRAETFFAARV